MAVGRFNLEIIHDTEDGKMKNHRAVMVEDKNGKYVLATDYDNVVEAGNELFEILERLGAAQSFSSFDVIRKGAIAKWRGTKK